MAITTGLTGALLGAVRAIERTMMYPAPQAEIEPHLAGTSVLRIPGADGRTVFAWHAPAPGGAPTVVHFHGNGETIADEAWLVEGLMHAGLGAYVVEYPGYGLARRSAPSEAAIYADAERALVHLRDALGVPDARVVLMGQSLGTGVAVEMAVRGHGARLVLVSPYTSMPDMARRIAPLPGIGLVLRDRYATLDKAPRVTLPALVVHGNVDALIPVAMGRTVAQRLPHAEFVEVERAGHNDVWSVGGSRLFARVTRFARGE